LPREVAAATSPGVLSLSTNTAGGRVRFRTNSKRVAIIAKYDSLGIMPHFPFTGSVGLDVFADDVFMGGYVPPVNMPSKAYESVNSVGDGTKDQDITINLPLYSNLTDLYIGIDEDATLSAPTPYKYEKPIVYYGSSITQGGCASRPGTSYESIVSRFFDCNYINLGFSGNARGEDEMTDYIKSLDMSVFVLDYDHNAPNEDHLRATHEKMFLEIRKNHPTLPIIIMSRPKQLLNKWELERLDIITATYENARSRGDKNVYLLTNRELTALCGNEGTVDNCHPTDFGFASMAQALISVLKKIL
jgi:hypothetical protein